MKILITGATGFVGTRLLEKLMTSGYDDLRVLTRSKDRFTQSCPLPIEAFEWDPKRQSIEAGALQAVEAIIHLAGEGVADGRWNRQKKLRILDSRVNSTKLLMNEIKKQATIPKVFISASAIGIYGDRGDESLDSNSSLGEGFLADVCKEWEKLLFESQIEDMRKAVVRTGIVLGKNGGALKKMLPPFKAGVAGNLGNGKQYMSWIHLDDLVGQYIHILKNERCQGIYNGVAPTPKTNAEFTKTLGKVLKRPTLFPIPAFGLKLLFGEMSQILLNSQKVNPSRITTDGYQYQYSDLETALRNILEHDLNGEKELLKQQFVKKKLSEVFSFFSNETNLEKLTPPFLKFKVLGKDTPQIQAGTKIDYKLSLRGIPIRWQTEIIDFQAGKGFVDHQLKGPYAKWHHTHRFYQVKDGTLLVDKVIYKIPFGLLGRVFAGHFVSKDIEKIFKYRHKVIQESL